MLSELIWLILIPYKKIVALRFRQQTAIDNYTRITSRYGDELSNFGTEDGAIFPGV